MTKPTETLMTIVFWSRANSTGIYLTITMGMTSLSIILTVFVLQLYHVTPRQRPVPRWLRHLMFDVISRALRMRAEVDGYRLCAAVEILDDVTDDVCKTSSSSSQRPPSPDDRRRSFNETASSRDSASRISNGLMNLSAAAELNTSDERCRHVSDIDDGGNEDYTRKMSNNRSRRVIEIDGGRTSEAGCFRIAVVRSGTAGVGGAVCDRLSSDEKLRQTIANEWKLVALIMDRLLFVLFLIVSSVSTFGILVVHPLTKPSIVE